MCGIIAVVRRRADAPSPPPSRRRSTPSLADACAASIARHGRAARRRSTRCRRPRSRRVDRAPARRARACRRCSATARCSPPVEQPRRRPRRARSTDLEDRLDDRRRPGRRRPRGRQRRADPRSRTRCGPSAATGCAPPAAVADLAGPDAGPAGARGVHLSIQQALSALDRLEVRGRDSAGLHLLVRDHGLDLAVAGAGRTLVAERADDPLFGAAGRAHARRPPELRLQGRRRDRRAGRQHRGAARRRSPATSCCARPSPAPDAEAVVLGHTRWASVGIISAAQRPPAQLRGARRAPTGPYVTAVLNGDVDNFADLKATEALRIAAEITTDAKVIPTLMSRAPGRRASDPIEAFRAHGAALEGSVAIGASAAAAPDQLLLALRGSGQALYVGLAEDAFIVASEPYGVVEETATLPAHGRRDAGRPRQPDRQPGPDRRARRARRAGTLDGIDAAGLRRHRAAGAPTTSWPPPRSPPATSTAATSRTSCSRRSPRRRRRSARRCAASSSSATAASSVALGAETLPDDAAEPARATARSPGCIVIGQGTAAVAGQSLAVALGEARRRHRRCGSRPCWPPSSRASGCAPTCPTRSSSPSASRAPPPTPTAPSTSCAAAGRDGDRHRQPPQQRPHRQGRRRALHLRRSRRRDERGVDQGVLRADRRRLPAGASPSPTSVGAVDRRRPAPSCSRALRDLPDAHGAARSSCRPAASPRPPSGSRRAAATGPSSATAPTASPPHEVRIKLSELCYKSIACDATEDKKHIDLSSEPLILVCAAGLVGSTADDVAKEVAIYRAHKAAPIVIATEGEERFSRRARTSSSVPADAPARWRSCCRPWPATCSATRRRWPSTPRPARCARRAAAIEAAIVEPGRTEPATTCSPSCGRALEPLAGQVLRRPARRRLRRPPRGQHRGAAGVAVPLRPRHAARSRRTSSSTARSARRASCSRTSPPALTRAIEELTRPVDAIKHQAKTVTVGISRSDETLLQVPLVAGGARRRRAARPAQLPHAAHARPTSTRRSPRSLGFTRYRDRGRSTTTATTPPSSSSTGAASSLELPVAHRATTPRCGAPSTASPSSASVLVARGRSDGRTV